MTKPDDVTWQEYIYDESEDKEEIKSKQSSFVEETEAALRKSDDLDEERFEVIESNRWVTVEADEWQMDKQDGVEQVRDALRGQDVGDGSVRVVCIPWSAEDEGPGALPPQDGYEYSVQVELMREREVFLSAVKQSNI